MSKIFLALFLLVVLINSSAGIDVVSAPSELKADDKIECKVMSKAARDSSKDALSYSSLGGDYSYFNATSENCFSFRVKSDKDVHIAMSSIPNNSPDMLEAVLNIYGAQDSIIRKRSDQKPVVTQKTPNVLNNKEFLGFWIHYTASGLVEVGRENEAKPFLTYQHSSATKVNYIGITAFKTYGNWLIDSVPKCPGLEQAMSRQSDMYEFDCGKEKNANEKSLAYFVNMQNNVLGEMKKITNTTCSTNVLELEDIQQDLEELFKLSKMIHQEIVLFRDQSEVVPAVKTNEESTFREIRKLFFNHFQRKSL